MHMTVKNRLARNFTNVDTDIISIRMKTFVYFLHDIFLNHVHSLFLMISQITV